MVRKNTSKKIKKTPAPQVNQNSDSSKYLIGIALIVVLLLAIFQLGIVGIYLANTVKFILGDWYQLISLVAIFAIVYLVFLNKGKVSWRIYLGVALFTVGLLMLLSVNISDQLKNGKDLIGYTISSFVQDIANQSVTTPIGGGIIGNSLYTVLRSLISPIGAFVTAIISLVSGFVLFTNLIQLAKRNDWSGRVAAKTAELKETQMFKKADDVASTDPTVNQMPLVSEDAGAHVNNIQPTTWNESLNSEITIQEAMDQADSAQFIDEIGSTSSSNATPTKMSTIQEQQIEISKSQLADQIETIDNPNYKLPSAQLLSVVKPTDQSAEYSQLARKSQIVHDTLKSFNIEAEVVSVSLGPTVTQYELRPATGVKVSKIANLNDDLAMALAAKSIRVQAPIPGKSLVGIEVPNEIQATVGFRDMIEHTAVNEDKLLTVPLGRNVTGQIVTADLASMPHLLIAGSTGSGKSVAINGIISSLLMQTKPSQVKMLMVDPKKVELSVYNDVPHLLTPVVSEPRKAAKALQRVVLEMEKRYELFAQLGIRNIDGYNKKVDETNKSKGQAMLKMPFIVVIVDELADLMMTASGEVEPAIIRIAQMGRAAGIHLILATQRPSVDVITGLIKANVPSRIAFAVSSGIDSRTILDQNGAEKLLGKGDMLFAPIGKQPERVQGAFISDQDVESISDFVRSQQSAQYAASLTVTDADVDGTDAAGDGSEDDLFDEAKDFVIDQKKASTSLLQRKFRIGYNRAARLIDDLEAANIIGPQDGSRPREVYTQKE